MEPMPGAASAAPEWLRPLLTDVEARLKTDPDQRWRDRDLRSRGLNPVAVRSWFRREHGLTFQAYARARRLSVTLGRTRKGPLTTSAGARTLVTTRFETPLGTMVAAAVDEGVAILEFTDRRMLPRELDQVCRRLNAAPKRGSHRHLEQLRAQLDEYFAGRRTAFDVPIALTGTPFEEASWSYLRSIPPGETRSYAEGALALGRPTAVRAFARANGANRLAIVIPCHRVIGSDGSLTGYGGGLWRKQALLDLEARAAESAA
jgi:AraC family transcriptional regulator of adaptative response/methylated-DNA-[protein]-cysteine methyltransferase